MTTIPSSTAGQAAGAAGTSGSTATQNSEANSGLNQLDNSQTFLQLLVAQLQNQDPLNPTNPSSFMTEIAQMTSVQSQTNLTAEEQTVAADSMIGQTVTGSSTSGGQIQGLVTGVLLSSSGSPTLEVGTQDVPIGSITQVGGTTATPASSDSASSS